MNHILIPLVLATVIVAAVCLVSIANLKSQQHDVETAWRHLNELRQRGIEAVPSFVAAVGRDEEASRASSNAPTPLRRALNDVESASRAAVQADGPRSAAAADDRLVRAIERVYAAAEVDATFVAGTTSRQASSKLDSTMSAISQKQQIYNNTATIAANARRSFPAVLFAKRLGLNEPERYESEAAVRRAALDWTRESLPSLADASPHVMSPQMLWVSSMADLALDDRTAERRR
ncbi:hypothetical protein C1878_00555 [Gordonibacter sp. 28C]|uniref:LemA family protein n=1 Tax=Gordonibacter sp. 28C TaxID=2078569 RepID=UPI000DF849DD|nr:LemA family protein [Gordonibacter sp. 28C]RDB64386.1 hypothetical protein C1878_00555 [Gordonibacter sp. 28C]